MSGNGRDATWRYGAGNGPNISSEDIGVCLTVESSGTCAVVRVSGEIDLYSAPTLEKALIDLAHSGITGLIIDLADCQFFDSEGFKVLIKTYRALGAEKRITVRDAKANVLKAFRILRMDRILNLEPPLD